MEATPAAVDDDRPVVMTLHARSHRFHGGQRGGHVGPVREAVDDRGPLGERAEEDRTVGDRLLAGCADGAATGSAAVDDEDAWRRHDSCSARARYPAGLDGNREGVGVGAVDHQDQHPEVTLGRMRDLNVVDADSGVGGQRCDLGDNAVTVGHPDPQLSQVVGSYGTGREASPGGAGLLERRQDPVPILGGHPVPHSAEIREQRIERIDDCRRVLGADIRPNARMPRCDAGHVTKAACGEAEQGAVLFGTVRRRIHQGGRDQVRHVGHHGHEPVVIGG